MSQTRQTRHRALIAASAVALSASIAAAQNVNATLAAGGGTANWGDGATWSTGTVPNATDAAVNINGTFTSGLSLDLQDAADANRNYTVGNLTFQDTAGTYRDLVLQNGTITAATSTGAATWLQNTASGGSQALIHIGATASVATAAAQTLELRVGNNPTVSATDVTGPAVRISSPAANWSGFLGTLTLSKGLFQMNAANVLPQNRTVTLGTATDAAFMRISSSTGQTVAGLDGNAQSFVFNITAATAATLTINGTGTSTFAGTIGSNGHASFAQAGVNIVKSGGGTQSFTGNIVNLGATGSAVTVNGGTLALSGANIYAGLTTVNGGTLKLGSASALGTTAAGTTVNNSGTLDLNGQSIGETVSFAGGTTTLLNTSASVAALSVDANLTSNLTVNATGDVTATRLIGTGAPRTLTKEGAGTFTTNGAGHNNLVNLVLNAGTVVFANTGGYGADRGVTINGGTLKLGGTNSNLINDGQSFTVNGGAYDLNGKGEAIASVGGTGGTILNNGATAATLFVGGGNAGTSSASYAGVIADGTSKLSLTKEGTGTQALAGVNTYTGNTTVTAGRLELLDDAALRFVIGASGTNNAILGAGDVVLAGDFDLDLAGASANVGDGWQLVSGVAATYASTFGVAGFSESADVWTKAIDADRAYRFEESTGRLSVVETSVPEPTTLAAVAAGLGTLVLRRRRA